MKNYVPKPEQVLEVIKTLEEAKERYYPKLNISETRVRHICGTTHCVGGAYALLKRVAIGWWLDGAYLMAIDLGFDRVDDLEQWLYGNPKFWGNSNGRFLFSEKSAYTPKDKKFAENFDDITDHFWEFYYRVYFYWESQLKK